MPTDPVIQLEREWQLISRGEIARRLPVWAEKEPALAAFPNPELLIRVLDKPGLWNEHDAVLGALLAQARSEPLAGRVVLKTILPGLKRIAERTILDPDDRHELWQHLLISAWETIRTYPLERRPSRIAANLLLDTRRKALDRFVYESARLADPLDEQAEEVEDLRAEADVEEPLVRAIAAGVLTDDDAELILRTRVDGVSLAVLAAETGTAYDAMRLRRRRAELRLLLFLGEPAVRFGTRKPHVLSARVAGSAHPGRRR